MYPDVARVMEKGYSLKSLVVATLKEETFLRELSHGSLWPWGCRGGRWEVLLSWWILEWNCGCSIDGMIGGRRTPVGITRGQCFTNIVLGSSFKFNDGLSTSDTMLMGI